MFNQLRKISPTISNFINKSKGEPPDGSPPQDANPAVLPPKDDNKTVPSQGKSKGNGPRGQRMIKKQKGKGPKDPSISATPRSSLTRSARKERRYPIRENRFSSHRPHGAGAYRNSRILSGSSIVSAHSDLEDNTAPPRGATLGSPSSNSRALVEGPLPPVFVEDSSTLVLSASKGRAPNQVEGAPPPGGPDPIVTVVGPTPLNLLVPPETGARNKRTSSTPIDAAVPSRMEERERVLSEELYDTPDALAELLRGVRAQVADYPRLQLEENWRPLIEPRYIEISHAIQRVSRYVVMNEFTDMFEHQISTLTEQLTHERDQLLSNAAETVPASVFRSRFARNLDAGEGQHGPLPTPHGSQSSSFDQSSFQGFPLQSEVMDIENRLTRLEHTVKRHRQDYKATVRQINQLTQAASDHKQITDSLNKAQIEHITGLEAKVSALTDKVAALEQSPLSLKDVDDRVMSALSRFRSAHGPLPSSTLGASGAGPGASSPQGEVERRLRFEVDTLKTVTKALRSRIHILEQQQTPASNSTVRISSLPVAERSTNASAMETDFAKRSLERMIERLQWLTSTPVTENTEITEIRKRHAVDIPKVQRTLDDFAKRMNTYCKGGELDDVFYQDCLKATDAAEAWVEQVECLYDKKDIHAVDAEKGKEGINVNPFAGDHTQTIFEFLEDFEGAFITVGTSKRRANILHKKYLSSWISLQTSSLMNDYAELKSWLIEQYGAAETVAKTLVEYLESLKKPTGTDSDRLTFYLTVSHTLTRLERLERHAQLSDLKVHTRSWHILERLVAILPKEDDNLLMKVLRDNGLSTRKLQGPYVLDHYKHFILSRVDDLKRNVERESKASSVAPKTKAKGAMHVETQDLVSSDDSDHEITSYHANTSSGSPQKQWWTNGLAFPCHLPGHDHELGNCKEFLTMCADDRRKSCLNTNRRICWTCLRPLMICKRSCKSTYKPIENLLCKGCQPKRSSQKKPAISMLFCSRESHLRDRPSAPTMAAELKKYLKTFPKGFSEEALVYANFSSAAMNLAMCSCKGPNCKHKSTATPPPDPDSKTPVIDTQTGQIADPDNIQSVTNSNDDACFLMQWIKIGTSNCLVMFDRGANVNLIDGALAERENLKVITDQPSGIKIVGGGETPSGYGRYGITLGSTVTGKFHTLECHGMSPVTARFAEYDLDQVNEETRKHAAFLSNVEALPSKVGGSVVHLLIGMKDVSLDPQHLGTLPSGIGVYRSPFVGTDGSTICYGGPHPTFSKANQGKASNYAAMFVREANRCRDNIYGLLPPIPPLKSESSAVLAHIGAIDPITITNTETPTNTEQATTGDEPASSLDEWLPSIQGAHLCAVNKALIPISKLRELIDHDDIDDIVSFRCPDCSKCIKCKVSSKTAARSIQDSAEHAAIERSIHIDRLNCKVWVDLPFLKNPDTTLKKQHNGPDNFSQALKVYQSQCRKAEAEKDSLRLAHKELVDRGFLVRLADLSPEHQQLIQRADFRHYMIWRGQGKADSPSTPCRIIVDPTMSGLNLCLPKGENRLAKINEIIIKSRASKYTWATDISKMYNQLALSPNSYRYQLFLYSQSLDPSVAPEIWVMVTAWYGMVPTGNQAGEAINMLIEENKSQHPMALAPLATARYVDDINSGADTSEEREAQIKDVQAVLAKGGFRLKYVVRSGEKPCKKASTDGTSLKLLGYKYAPVEDILCPAFVEVNPNKKVRGIKRPNKLDATSISGALAILKGTKITRKVCMSLLAEFYDPVGLFEPIKLQYKLALSQLNKFDYREALPPALQAEWRTLLADLALLPELKVPRCVLPDTKETSPLRLLCLSDAGEQAGGAVVYVGTRLADGSYSCSMLTARSKLLKATVPRNELTAVMLMAELAFIVKRALGDKVEEIVYLTDSTIALSWCQNTSLKLRMFVYNRVESIRRLIQWTTDSEEVPLFHIQGMRNMADMVTKPQPISFETVDGGSPWQTGQPWMLLPTDQLPITKYDGINITAKKKALLKAECFEDPYFLGQKESDHTPLNAMIAEYSLGTNPTPLTQPAVHGPLGSPPRPQLLLDLVEFGWFKSIRILKKVLIFAMKLKHSCFHTGKSNQEESCPYCCTPTNWTESLLDAKVYEQVESYLFRQETRYIKLVFPKKKLDRLVLKDDILYFSGRLSEENPFRFRDLDALPFLDSHEIAGLLPVVLSDSPVFFAYLMAIHTRIVPHAGVLTTMKEVSKKMFVPNALRKIVAKVRADCTTCRIIMRQTVELEMKKHKFPRTMLAPVFYNVMADIAYGFRGQPFKNARKRVDVYALVIVCLLTGATNIMALEGLETQDIVSAIQTHSCRHGVPAEVFIDNGSQLKALKHAKFSILDADLQLQDALGLRLTVSNAKSHEEQGRVERRIRLIRDMLERLTAGGTLSMTALQWQSMFATVANTIDNLPLAKGNNSNGSEFGFEILTANRLKLGRNNQRSLADAGISLQMSPNLTKLLDRNRDIQQSWYQLFIDQIHLLAPKPPKWESTGRLPVPNDIVLFVVDDSELGKKGKTWRIGRVLEANTSKVKVEYTKGKKSKRSTLERNPRDISILFSQDELFVNSSTYFQSITHE